jgi:transcriptional regulator with XRE-family HTH domain
MGTAWQDRYGSVDPLGGSLMRLVRARREAQDKTVRDLAAELGKSPAYVSMVENGKQAPDPEMMQLLVDVLDIHGPLRTALLAWAELRRPSDALSSMGAARQLRGAVEELGELDVEHSQLLQMLDREVLRSGRWWRASAPLAEAAAMPTWVESRRAAHGIPVVPEGMEHSGRGQRPGVETLALDAKLLSDIPHGSRPYAWRLSRRGVERVPDVLSAGDYVVIVPVKRARVQRHDDIWVVRLRGEFVLGRLLAKGRQLMLLPPPGSHEGYEFVEPARSPKSRTYVAGRVALAIRRWQDLG